jgi:hypothetical protein
MKMPKKMPRTAFAIPAVLLLAACGAAATTASDDKAAAPSGRSAVASAPKALNPELGDAANLDSAASLDKQSTASGNVAEDAPMTATGSGGTSAEVPTEQPEDQQRAVISKGQISLHTKDVDGARFDLKKDLDTWGGTIASEESDADDDGHTKRQRLELRVPSAKFDVAMDALSRLAGTTLVDRSRTSEDVTTKVIDNAARVRTQKLSLARVQALLAQAETLNQIISIESQLSRRQANLDSLEQQQKYLADQTSLSTIDVYLSVPAKHVAKTKKKQHDDSGFLAGLRGGWNNLGDATNTVLHAVGGLLPFGAVLLVVGVPLWAARRRRSSVTA